MGVDKGKRRFFKFTAASVVVVAVGGFSGYTLNKLSKPKSKGIDVPDTEENMKLCICPQCPAYTGTPLTGGVYCATGKSREEVKKLGCICGVCPVTDKYGLKTGYFCIKGKSIDVPQ